MTGAARRQLADYLALRRALGYRLARPEKLLGQFLDYLDARRRRRRSPSRRRWTGRGCPPTAARTGGPTGCRSCAASPPTCTRSTRRTRCRAADLLPQRPRRASPYLYSDAEIAALIAATGTLRTPLRRATFATLIGLLAVTGMRVGEAIALDRGDVDLAAGRLLVRHGKFGKSRELAAAPHAPSPRCARYQRLRDRLAPATGHGGVLRLPGRNPAALLQRPRTLPPARPPGRAHAAVGVVPAPHPRPAPLLRGRTRCSTPTPPARTGRPG